MNKNNDGYSLVELIIVIAIMALLTGTAFFSISMIFGAGAKACANDLKEALAENKVIAMGKNEARLEVRREEDGIYVIQWMYVKADDDTWKWIAKQEDAAGGEIPEKIGNSRVSVAYVPEGSDEKPLKTGESLWLCYDRSNGSFSSAEAAGRVGECILCEEIYVRGGSRSYKLTLTELTGKVEVELERELE